MKPDFLTLAIPPLFCRAIPLIIALALSACGGNNEDGNLPPPLFSGTVSTPKGISEQQVEFKSIDGSIKTAVVDNLGQYVLDTAERDERYLMRVDLGNFKFLYSFAYLREDIGNRQNIHSYTDLVARTWFADQGLDINSVFSSAASIENFPSSTAINAIDANIQAIVSDALDVYGLSAVNLSTEIYDATDTGVDRFLNENPVIIKDNRATIIVNDPQTNLQAIAVNRVPLQTTFGAIDITPPQQPQNLRALGARTNASSNEIILAWSVASDNIGVATYEIFRNDVLIGHTPFPTFRDTNISPGTDYIYAVVTRDESANRSLASVSVTGRALQAPDTMVPNVPSSATVNATTDSVDVFWTHANIYDLARFEITRTGGDSILVREVTSTKLSDITVASGTEYCYSIVAVDASANRSAPNPTSCITTSGSTVSEQEQSTIPSTVEMAQESISGIENSVVSAYVNRLGDAIGEISIDYIIAPGTATAEEDYLATDGTLVWADGDITAKQIDIRLLPDIITEELETLSVVLTNSSTNAVIVNAMTSINIIDRN